MLDLLLPKDYTNWHIYTYANAIVRCSYEKWYKIDLRWTQYFSDIYAIFSNPERFKMQNIMRLPNCIFPSVLCISLFILNRLYIFKVWMNIILNKYRSIHLIIYFKYILTQTSQISVWYLYNISFIIIYESAFTRTNCTEIKGLNFLSKAKLGSENH